MINHDKLAPIIAGYKDYFPTHWEGEKYKWEAIKHFQDNWDLDADDFADMFKRATAKTGNLLTSRNSYPRNMIINYAQADGKATRAMFRDLFD